MSKRLISSIENESLEEDTTPALIGKVCNAPAMGALLPDYIAELLADSIEEEVEDHMLDCFYCREKYLKVLCIGNALRSAKAERGNEDDQALPEERGTDGARVLQMADFREVQS